MLTFKQTVFLLVSIITILALIAIATGLSPLYWPHPKTLTNENNVTRIIIKKVNNTHAIKTQLTTRPRPITKKTLLAASVSSITTLFTTLSTTTSQLTTNSTNITN
ncbi:unnamed protein product [Adineta ricciae]|uniref:Uncharacterized protein n=1 Tax=Adineta ricciae TaxID=249248 RepID=A0A813T5R0_ADIRI|nr:unnamed protein product [Adineta ricciae]CAF1211439.1 unnamed protein product [Adineta ricciae]